MPSPTANAVFADGLSTYAVLNALPAGVVDNTFYSASMWLKRLAISGQRQVVRSRVGSSDRVGFGYRSDNVFFIYLRNSGGNTLLDARCDFIGQGVDVLDWHHVAFCVDISVTPVVHIYCDRVELTVSIEVFSAGNINHIGFPVGLAAKPNGANPWDGDLSRIWVNSSYVDFTDSANLDKFIDSSGCPVPAGANGEIPTGTSPDYYFAGPTNTWHENLGTAGTFTEVGAFTDSTTSPSDGCGGPPVTAGSAMQTFQRMVS